MKLWYADVWFSQYYVSIANHREYFSLWNNFLILFFLYSDILLAQCRLFIIGISSVHFYNKIIRDGKPQGTQETLSHNICVHANFRFSGIEKLRVIQCKHVDEQDPVYFTKIVWRNPFQFKLNPNIFLSNLIPG